jgi:hypothetical protein
MTTRQKKALQKSFLNRSATSTAPLEKILEELKITPQTFVTWMNEREFQSKLHGMKRFVTKTRELQIQTISMRAASLLSTVPAEKKEEFEKVTDVQRAACMDVIRMARDSRARRRNQKAKEIHRDRRIAHPDLSDAEAERLVIELSESQWEGKKAAKKEVSAKGE